MPPAKDPIWKHFLTGERQNKSHIRVHCRGCIEKERLENEAIELQAYTQEARLMELLEDEEADEERMPDDEELEGSGDDYEG